jgi:MFS family permease
MASIDPGAASQSADRAAGQTPRTPLLLRHLLTLSIYWLGVTTIWAGLNSIVIPARLDEINPERVGLLLAVINAVGVVAPILVQPTVGMISDYTVTRWGRRKPYIVIGTVLDIVFLVGLASSQTYLSLVALYLLLQVSSNIAQGPFQGYVPDLVPAKQVSMASGFMGVMIVLGQITGTAVATLGVTIGSLFIGTVALGAVEALTMVVLILTIDEGSPPPPRRESLVRIALSAWGTDLLRHGNIFWLLAVRAMFLGAVAAPINLALLYFRRTHGMALGDASTMVLAGTAIIGVTTALAAIPGARLSDRYGRRPLIWAACAIGATGLVGLAVAPNEWMAIALFVPFGVATGTFLSVDWALMTDAIPKGTTGRFMGILNAGTAVAAPLFLAVAGPTLDGVGALMGEPYGPRAAMLVAVVFLLAAALALLVVDPRRREH